jgi:hypothetical protein
VALGHPHDQAGAGRLEPQLGRYRTVLTAFCLFGHDQSPKTPAGIGPFPRPLQCRSQLCHVRGRSLQARQS